MQNTVKTEAETAQTTALPFVSPMKDVPAVPQLTQHAGMFPQGYILPNGHAATADYVQAQAAAAAQVSFAVETGFKILW